MTQQHHEEAESGSEGEGEASARRSASDLRAAGIDGVGSGDGEAVLQRAPRWPA
ncbi:hypothetical protein [Adlercreutzia sp.]|uniref:hypothetical protein n=1 Tax=Adlercreutzia sp. TaxID=1872387 RepID=UPI003AEFB120